jgi:hypothetical protein
MALVTEQREPVTTSSSSKCRSPQVMAKILALTGMTADECRRRVPEWIREPYRVHPPLRSGQVKRLFVELMTLCYL